jgi:5-(carboxyamino)imidazole ribonucleotide synthase
MGPAQENIVACFGGGQLGRMLAMAGHRFGVNVRCMDTQYDACAGQVTAPLVVGSYSDPVTVASLLAGAQVATLEFENIPASVYEVAQHLNVPVYPSQRALQVSQDRVSEKAFAEACGFKTARYAIVNDSTDIRDAILRVGLPGFLKKRRDGYDGKGQRRISSAAEFEAAVGQLGTDLIYEASVEFLREWSQVSVRGRDGKVKHYALNENRHDEGILRVTRVDVESRIKLTERKEMLTAEARRIATIMMERLDYVGVFTVELFEQTRKVGGVDVPELIVNEIAPRVHNSGHHTIEGAVTSQFENHLRAVCGYELGSTDVRERYIGMVNLIGDWKQPERLWEGMGDGIVHLYGKEGRPGRKIGHVTILSRGYDEREAAIAFFVRQCKFRRLGLLSGV